MVIVAMKSMLALPALAAQVVLERVRIPLPHHQILPESRSRNRLIPVKPWPALPPDAAADGDLIRELLTRTRILAFRHQLRRAHVSVGRRFSRKSECDLPPASPIACPVISPWL